MEQVKVSFPDGSIKEYNKSISFEEIAASISSGLKKKAIAAKFNGQVVDLKAKVLEDGSLEIITAEDEEGLKVIRHSTAHLMAQAIKRLFKEEKIQLGVGPVIDNGFYYDIDMEHRLTEEDLPRIEKEMIRIADENLPIERREVSRDEAINIYQEVDDEFKLELIRELPSEEQISIYYQGEFFDLCRGPHVPQTSKLRIFKLMSVAGAYWRGNSDNKMLQRIYGAAFASKQELEDYLHFLEEAKKRDHRKLGKELELYMFSEEAPGMPFYLPKGQILRNELENFSRYLQNKNDYEEVRTPLMMNQRLWEQSGHWDHYHENMYFAEVDDARFALKPMNCPGHMLIYKNKLHSYRDLPIRIAEFGQVHRHEFSGALNGMIRVRTFCQDDAHIFVSPEQIEGEIKEVFKLIDLIYRTFGFEYAIELSTRPEDSMGSDELWEKAEDSLRNVLEDLQLPYHLNVGDGAFYGPKIDFHIKDALNRSHQCATIQVDFQMPEKFDLSYINEAGEKVRPVIIHRAIFGSIDRFIGILVEHFAGAFPSWLAPIQAIIIPVSNVHADYAKKLERELKESGIRAQSDLRDEKIGYKIREGQMQKIPYLLVIGDQEIEQGSVNIRKYGMEKSESVAVKQFIAQIQEEIKNRKL